MEPLWRSMAPDLHGLNGLLRPILVPLLGEGCIDPLLFIGELFPHVACGIVPLHYVNAIVVRRVLLHLLHGVANLRLILQSVDALRGERLIDVHRHAGSFRLLGVILQPVADLLQQQVSR